MLQKTLYQKLQGAATVGDVGINTGEKKKCDP